MESQTAVAAWAQVLGPGVKLAEKGFEIRPVDEQARGLLRTVEQVAGQLDNARMLRRQKSVRFTDYEKRMFDDTFRQCEDAIRQVASLTERPSASLEGTTRLIFLLRSSPMVNVSLTQLGIAGQSLNAAIAHLNSRDSRPSSEVGSPLAHSPRHGVSRPPPGYEESQFLASGRRRNMQRRATAMGLATVGPPPNQPPPRTQQVLPDRSRTLSASTLHIPMVPSIAELVGDESFPERSHRSLPIITVAGAPIPPSDPIVIEAEPIVLSPAMSPTALSQSNSSPPQSPPPRRFNSVSSSSNSDPGGPSSNHYTPPHSTGVQTPPNSWAPQFQQPRPPPNYTYPPPNHPVIMPAQIQYTYPPQQNTHQSHSTMPPPIPPQSSARGISPNNSWGPQQFQNYRPHSGSLGPASNQDYRPNSSHLGPSPDQGLRPVSGNHAPGPHSNAGIPNTLEPRRTARAFEPYSPDFEAPMSPTGSEQDYIYTPSVARQGQGARHRSRSWMAARAQV